MLTDDGCSQHRVGRWSITTVGREVRTATLPGTEITGGWPGTPGNWAAKAAWIAQMTRTMRMTARL